MFLYKSCVQGDCVQARSLKPGCYVIPYNTGYLLSLCSSSHYHKNTVNRDASLSPLSGVWSVEEQRAAMR